MGDPNSGEPVSTGNNRIRYANFGIVWTTQTMTALLIYAVPALAPLIVTKLSLSRTEIGIIVGMTYVGISAMSTFFGVIADSIGIRKVLFMGHVIEAASIIGASAAHSFLGLALAILGVGIGYSAITPVTSKAILDWFSRDQRSSVMSLKQTGVTVGGGAAGFIFPLIGVKYGLSASFAAGGALVILGSVFLLGYKETENPQTASLAFLRKGLSLSLKNKDLVWDGGIGFFYAAVQAVVVTYIALFAQAILGVDAVVAGLFLSLVNISGTIGRPVYGIISDRVLKGSRIKDLFVISMTSCVMLLVLSELPVKGSLWISIPIVAALGFGALGWNGVFLTLAGEHSGKGYEGVGTSFAYSIAMAGQIVGAPVFGFIVDSTGSFEIAWRAYAITLILASIVYTVARRKHDFHN